MWVGLNTNWFVGGEANVDGISNESPIDNWRVGATFSTPIAKSQLVKLQVHMGAFTNNGLSYNAVSLNYQYSFF